MEVRDLEPIAVWNHFEDLNAIPRPSKKEEKVREFMVNFGKSLGLETLVDEIGNIIIKKPGSTSMANREIIILQSHVDMVHQKNSDTDFDFASQGIQSWIDGDWVKAKGTTLGADNGMGVASAMALLSSYNIDHPPLECLFTVDEETGMTGAKHLDGSLLSGKILLNLDTEDDDEISIGCAGGIDTNTTYDYSVDKIENGYSSFQISIKGLKGGHSGMDIHLGRGNANLLLNRILFEIAEKIDIRIGEFDGGSLRNAIPREAFALVAVPEGSAAEFKSYFEEQSQLVIDELSVSEPDLSISLQETEAVQNVISVADQHKILSVLYTTPNAVWKMSDKIPGLVETSSSLARVIIKEGQFITQSLQRSMIESGKRDIANALRLNYEGIGAEVVQGGDYPGWSPNPNSSILKIVENKYKEMFSETPRVEACHAGLECGILQEHLSGCDMVSFGPTIKNPHSPDEKVSIKSVQKFWGFLLEILKEIPAKN